MKTGVDLFLKCINKCYPNISFIMESETDHTLPYLDILITRHPDGKITNKVFLNLSYTWSLSGTSQMLIK